MAISPLPSASLGLPAGVDHSPTPNSTSITADFAHDHGHVLVAVDDPLETIGMDRSSLHHLKSLIPLLRQEGHSSEASLVERNIADRGQIAAFLDALFRYAESGFVQLRMFRDKPEDGAWGRPWNSVPVADRNKLIDMATQDANRAALAEKRVVFCPPVVTFTSPDRATEQDVAEGLVLSVECDKSPERARRRLEFLLGPATLVLKSGGKWNDPETGEAQDRCHLHWRLQEPTRSVKEHEKLKECRRLARLIVNGDGSAVPLVHPLRWAGSWHRKDEPRLCVIAALNPDAEIDLDDALDKLREAAISFANVDGANVEHTAHSSADLQATDPIDVTAAVAVVPNDNLEWDEWNRVGMSIWAATLGSDIGASAWHAFSAKSPKYDAATATARWKHYTTSPPTHIGAGTLFHLATTACTGWVRPSKHAKKSLDEAPWIERHQQAPQDDADTDTATMSQADSVPGYRMTETGLFFDREFSEAKPDSKSAKPIWLSPPFEIVARTLDPDENWGKLLRWNDHDGRKVTWVMPARLLGGHRDELWQALYERGLEISSTVEARNLLLAYLTRANPTGRAEVVSRLGWHGDEAEAAFVLPDQVFGGKDGGRIVYTGSTTDSPYGVSGSFDEWRERVGRLCVDNSRLVLAVSIAFASPLLRITGEESGGFHFRGGSRTGKTTAARLAGSVWGGGDGASGYLKTWRATSNGLEGVAEQHCDALLCLDEMGQVEAREAGEIAYMLGNNGGKQRAARDGSARRSKQWRVIFLSTGEVSLADKMTEIGRTPRAGQEVRLVDIAADAGAGLGIFETLHGAGSAREFAEQLKRATLGCYGSPIREYLADLVPAYQSDPQGMTAAFRDLRDDFIRDHLPADASGQVISVCGRFGIVAMAGELATGFGLTGWPKGEATQAATTCFKAWLDQRGTLGDHDIEAGIQQLIAFVETHGGSRFEELVSAGEWESTVSNRVGFRRFDQNTRVWNYYVLPNAFKTELGKGFDPKALRAAMVKRGLIVSGNRDTSQVLRMGRHGPMRVYVLKPGIINVPEPERSTAGDWITREMSEATNQIFH